MALVKCPDKWVIRDVSDPRSSIWTLPLSVQVLEASPLSLGMEVEKDGACSGWKIICGDKGALMGQTDLEDVEGSMNQGRLILSAAGLMTLGTSNGLMNVGANFLNSIYNGTSYIDSQSF